MLGSALDEMHTGLSKTDPASAFQRLLSGGEIYKRRAKTTQHVIRCKGAAASEMHAAAQPRIGQSWKASGAGGPKLGPRDG